ncbi:MAG: NADH-quinone oxidoreductase subunit J [Deltaproteobacteria bacterium]|nr:NADH-quinone oxidoreductase subunit J [Deltaproteobacteria bacterium]
MALGAALTLFLPGSALAAKTVAGTPSSPVVVAVFWALALLTLASGAGVAFSRNIVYASFSLLGAFLGVAGLYVFLSADFLAVAQVLIYIGGVLVLILFAVMLTSRLQHVKLSNPAMGMLPATLATVATTALLVFVALAAPWRRSGSPAPMRPTAEALGDLFLTRYLLPFEIASVVLLAALIGAVVLARKEIKPD